MKKQISFYILFIALIALVLAYHGCSEIEDNLTAPESPGVHGAGWVKPSSPNFHGNYIINQKWNLSTCKTCHGNDYKGGNTGLSCYKCHTQPDGPEACTTCHGGDGHANPPKGLHGETSDTSIHVGAHYRHLNDTTRFAAFVECTECHTQVNSFSDTNHIGPNPDGIAEIHFGELANNYLGGGIYPNPQINLNTGTCSGIYCHGSFKGGNVNNTVSWTQPGSATCGTCHGNPQTGNPNPAPYPAFYHDPNNTIHSCVICHSLVIDGNGVITHPELHVNGIINGNP
jgi:predicted CxxxxCH...CXXCH cytochrome family protein